MSASHSMTPTMHANNSPRKKALLVGMRYADNDRMTSDSELICCTLEEFRDRLIRQYGYSDEDIKIPELTGSTSTNMSREFIVSNESSIYVRLNKLCLAASCYGYFGHWCRSGRQVYLLL